MVNVVSGLVKLLKFLILKMFGMSLKKFVRFVGRDNGVCGLLFEFVEIEFMVSSDSEDFEDVKFVWVNVVLDEDGVGEMTDDTLDGTSGWRRVGESIIYNEEEVIGVGSVGIYVF